MNTLSRRSAILLAGAAALPLAAGDSALAADAPAAGDAPLAALGAAWLDVSAHLDGVDRLGDQLARVDADERAEPGG